jgi:hypothetical protein
MKYALLIYGSPELRDVPEDQLKSVVGEYEAIFETPGVLDGMQLQGTESATTVRVQNGEALLSDGPFVDAKNTSGASTWSRRTTSTRRRPSPRVFRRPAWAAPSRCVQSWSDRRAGRRGLPR